jgi:hypothetical protein
MLLIIERRGNRFVVTNNPPIRYKRFQVNVKSSEIIDTSESDEVETKQKALGEEVLSIRKKYPNLLTIDRLTSGLTANEPDENTLDNYFTQRGKEYSII